MVSITRSEKYKDIDITIIYDSTPQIQHLHHASKAREIEVHQEKIPSLFYPPKMVIKFKDKELNLNEHFHVIKTFGGRYFTHYIPYRFFESPLDLAYKIIDSLLIKEEMKRSENR
jgi:hypothetical protein